MTPSSPRDLMERHGWNLSSAARAIGRSVNWVRHRVFKAGLREEFDRNRLYGPRLLGRYAARRRPPKTQARVDNLEAKAQRLRELAERIAARAARLREPTNP